jgi:putative addiction module component (TIGR02574 family)
MAKRHHHMITQPIIESFRKLSLQELWDEVAEEATQTPLSEAHRQLLDERLQQHSDNPDDVEPWEKVRDDVLSEL